jgi:malate dehydrogenase (oxaloacetate-decarboxylating)(NADP+)
LLQFEDFATPNAVALLDRYQDKLLCFNDDIQGTAAVALAGLYASTRITGMKLSEQRYLFAGAGSAATGIGNLLVLAMVEEGISEEEAFSRIAICDSKGLITACRDEHKPHSVSFAQKMSPMTLEEAVMEFRPHALIGATGRAGMFTNKILREMAEINDHPVIFALSNPTSNAECTAEDAYNFTDGKAVFASGSPFGAVNINGEIRIPGQGNNAYIFPGLGLGVLQGEVTQITDELLIASARELAQCVTQVQIDHGCLYPPLNEIRSVSLRIAVSVVKTAAAAGLTSKEIGDDFESEVAANMYDPRY